MGFAMIRVKMAALGGVALALGGCVGEGEYTAMQQRVIDRADQMDAQSYRVNTNSNGSARANTSYGAMPDSGFASFAGHAVVAVDRIRDNQLGEGDFIAIGTGNLNVSFGDSSDVTGVFSDFVGADRDGQGQEFSGTLVISSGEVGHSRPNDFIADANLNLSGPSESYVMDTTINGDFVGTPIYGVRAFTNEGADAVVDGYLVRSGAIGIIAEAQ